MNGHAALAGGREGLRLGVIATTPAEAPRPVNGTTALPVVVSGGDPDRARRAAEELINKGVEGLVSIGFATGLAPILRPGDLIVAESVVLPCGEAIRTDEAWRNELVRRLIGLNMTLRVARIAGDDRLLVSPRQKRKAFQSTFAAAMDTESHAIAEVASAAGLPFIALRAVAEPAEQLRPSVVPDLPADGAGAQGLTMIGRLTMRPWEIPAALRYARNGRQALATLRRIAELGPEPLALPSRP